MTTRISDVVVPEVFTPYIRQETERKSRLIRSGAMVVNPLLSNFLAGGGLTDNIPSFRPLANDADNISSDDPAATSTPGKIGTSRETVVRLSRNKSWGSADLAAALAGTDPMNAIADNVSTYWANRLQAIFTATMTGVFADNAAAPGGSEHTQNDMTVDVSGSAFSDNTTNFTPDSFLEAVFTMGDAYDSLGLMMVHSRVMQRIQQVDQIDFVPDSEGALSIPMYKGRVLVVDDGMPHNGNVYQTWVFGEGAVNYAMGTPKEATEIERNPNQGNGGGTETLYSRIEAVVHPVGHRYVGTAPNGGPSNAATSNNLAAASSWQRVYPERNQIKAARLITREA